MNPFPGLLDRSRLLDTARALVDRHSPTGAAGPALDALADLLSREGFIVERPTGGHSAAAVAVRLRGTSPGPTMQFDGHLDTVHLPFSPSRIEGNLLTGSGACDMKGGTACAVETLRMLRQAGYPRRGNILFLAHDLHEAPWGLGEQLDALIREGWHGDAVLLPEPLTSYLPIVGRGAATWRVRFHRPGPPIHEVVRPLDEPDVIAAGASLVSRLQSLQSSLQLRKDEQAGPESVFVGQFHSGEIYNQYPQECLVEGTRRWLPGVQRAEVEAEFRALLNEIPVPSSCEFRFIRDPFRLDANDPLVSLFQREREAMGDAPLPLGAKPFVDDGNSFFGLGPIPCITHGPRSGGQHTTSEWIDLDDMARVAVLYARVAVSYCEEAPWRG